MKEMSPGDPQDLPQQPGDKPTPEISTASETDLPGSTSRKERLANIQAAIAAGTFRVSSAKIADKLIDSMSGTPKAAVPSVRPPRPPRPQERS